MLNLFTHKFVNYGDIPTRWLINLTEDDAWCIPKELNTDISNDQSL